MSSIETRYLWVENNVYTESMSKQYFKSHFIKRMRTVGGSRKQAFNFGEVYFASF